jgi:DNA-binding PadR family transcriptional regulator
MKPVSRGNLTTPDLVLLSLLAERPMHGYQANALLEFREVREWAGVSRPQVYYSLEKLARLKLIRPRDSRDDPGGPERRVFETTTRGRAALADALEDPRWTDETERPAFLTWMALSWQCRPGVFLEQLRKRRAFLENLLSQKKQTLLAVRQEVGHPFHEAVWMLGLVIAQIRTELRWLDEVTREAPERAAAQEPEYLLDQGKVGGRPPDGLDGPPRHRRKRGAGRGQGSP